MTNANGTEGYLLRDLEGDLFFRVYDTGTPQRFSDYRIDCYDMKIRIIDPHLVLDDKTKNIDYNIRSLLGNKVKTVMT